MDRSALTQIDCLLGQAEVNSVLRLVPRLHKRPREDLFCLFLYLPILNYSKKFFYVSTDVVSFTLLDKYCYFLRQGFEWFAV